MQYFTGSKNHNVQLRQRALKQGYTLNEYGLVRMEDNQRVAGKTEEEIYKKLGLAYIPPELREDCGEIQAAAEGKLPELITQADIQGDVHMHTVETDGKCTIEEMAEAARIAVTNIWPLLTTQRIWPSPTAWMIQRAEAHIKKIRAAPGNSRASRSLPGSRSIFWPTASLIFPTPSWSRWIL